jgi:hypothetical protein
MFILRLVTAACVVAGLSAIAQPAWCQAGRQQTTNLNFSFGPGKVLAGYTRVAPSTFYDHDRGYGFEPGSKVTAVDRGDDDPRQSGFCTSAKPLYFSVAVPEGNYRVTVTLGDRGGPSTTTVKAELRRLMLQRVQTQPGQIVTRSFTVNVRTPRIVSGGRVRLKSREMTTEMWNWDDKLTRLPTTSSTDQRMAQSKGSITACVLSSGELSG